MAVHGYEPCTPVLCRVLLTEMKGGGIEDTSRLFLYHNLVRNHADKAGSLTGLYRALGV